MEDMNISSGGGFSQIYNMVNENIMKNVSPLIFVLIVVIIIVYLLFGYLGNSQESSSISFLEVIVWGLLIFLILINAVQYYFEIDAKAAIKNLFTETPEVDVKVKSNKIKKEKKKEEKEEEERQYGDEVFNIYDNKYTYEQAEALCKAFDADLATYSQVEDSYNNGGEWCSYGWSKDQMALFPTQKSTWDALQKQKGRERECGRPGVNGGYFSDKNFKFGVNCYGKKPKISKDERELMKKISNGTEKNREEDKLVNYYKSNLDNILIAPFNKNNWNRV